MNYNLELKDRAGTEVRGIIPNTPDGYSVAMGIRQGDTVFGVASSRKGIRIRQVEVLRRVPGSRRE